MKRRVGRRVLVEEVMRVKLQAHTVETYMAMKSYRYNHDSSVIVAKEVSTVWYEPVFQHLNSSTFFILVDNTWQ